MFAALRLLLHELYKNSRLPKPYPVSKSLLLTTLSVRFFYDLITYRLEISSSEHCADRF